MAEEKKQQNEEEEIENLSYTLVDEDGNESEFELIGTTELDGVRYYAMVPAEESGKEDKEIYEYVILKSILDENNEETLVTIDDDEEFDKVADYFDDYFNSEVDYDA
ncbi:MAG: DUF1292 domain-containing protein [Clostridia bacterium]|nr:DUF1292 domain-containing protein [Clostridia bacterium]